MSDTDSKFPGLLIAVDGPDGVGKTTLANRLADRFQSLGHPCLLSAVVGGTELGDLIRRVVLHPVKGQGYDGNLDIPICAEAAHMLFQASIAQLIYQRIIPALQAGSVVILDRFSYSTAVYQSLLDESYFHRSFVSRTSAHWLEALRVVKSSEDNSSGGTAFTQLLLSAPTEVIADRLKSRESSHRSPWQDSIDLEHIRKIRLKFANLACRIDNRDISERLNLDGSESLSDVHAVAWHMLKCRIQSQYPHAAKYFSKNSE